MQTRFKRIWDVMVDEDYQPDPVVNFGFHNPEAAELYGYWFYVSGFNPAVLPNPGGLASQPKWLEEDLRTYLSGLSRTRWEYWQYKKALQGSQ